MSSFRGKLLENADFNFKDDRDLFQRIDYYNNQYEIEN